MVQFRNTRHIAHGHFRHLLEDIKVRKIRNSRITDYSDVDQPFRLPVEALRQAVLILQRDVHIGNDARHRHMPLFLQHLDTGIQNRLIAPELVDDQAFHPIFLLLVQEHQRPQELREDTAPGRYLQPGAPVRPPWQPSPYLQYRSPSD